MAKVEFLEQGSELPGDRSINVAIFVSEDGMRASGPQAATSYFRALMKPCFGISVA